MLSFNVRRHISHYDFKDKQMQTQLELVYERMEVNKGKAGM